jgi:hypothetical protein
MKTKEKTRRPANSGATEKFFPAVKESEMTSVDRKIHDLLIVEGYLYMERSSQRIEGIKCNNYRKVSRAEYIRLSQVQGREHERVIVMTHKPGSK